MAIRILLRRYADASAGGPEVSNFGLDGVLTVGFSKATLASLAAQIARPEDLLNPTSTSGRLQIAPILRPDGYW
ncbi:hypothetical protein [Sanguibacter suaedae]|uniref:Uncharacterized protein n=1 Tax=Sanguibacter suaedae TaxID=2795737 RepID=A0A934IAP6_9MICO|nr:hypothetical protein [Sanguibacter suaedae]MBI9114300.1 hypothetical protein [Sanguibacter suaedae]